VDRRDELEARVIDQDVEAAEDSRRLVNHRLNLTAVPDIGPVGDGPAAFALHLCGHLTGGHRVDVADAHGRTRGYQRLRDRPADPARGSGDDCGLAVKINMKPTHTTPS